ncbi:hypothetical protein DFA_03829 [Cavenderia fasciculata]|uniref:Uncharacterized protein n=1 Tax=Cavenderia fasciculata TaxID=261658 RepID=F4Q0I4_CACFS|nr:uncharacterized protein DFA_03829 [Cavenderia fasciculata]EGG18335.1 hypothetical protein DFA_03829 [Cavenderia fasciculata]|eukprot:XP_004366239.1 hypothetical protein DFA_03829 [Cavenderia fasciculata]
MDNQSYSYEYTKEELKGYDSTRLQQICRDRKIGGGSLSKKKKESILLILSNQEQRNNKYPTLIQVSKKQRYYRVSPKDVFYGSFGINKQSLVQMSTMMQGLVSFTAGMMVLDKSDFKVLASIQTLVKINIKYITYDPEWIYQKGGDLVLELVKLLDRPMIKLIMPVKYRLGLTVNPILQDSVETYGAASFGEEQLVSYKNLTKFICSGNQTLSNNHNNMSHLNNITHLCAELTLRETNSKENWIKVISSL